MTPEQFAVFQFWVTVGAIVAGPVAAVIFTFWIQKRRDKREAQMRVFMSLMAHRKTNPPSWELVNSLNLVDVAFDKDRRVVELWHQYYDLLCQEPLNEHLVEAKYLDLLAAMAKALDYSELSQTDIARFYSPRAHATQFQMNAEIQAELLRVLKNTHAVDAKDKPH